jgi:hypothetical protein
LTVRTADVSRYFVIVHSSQHFTTHHFICQTLQIRNRTKTTFQNVIVKTSSFLGYYYDIEGIRILPRAQIAAATGYRITVDPLKKT